MALPLLHRHWPNGPRQRPHWKQLHRACVQEPLTTKVSFQTKGSGGTNFTAGNLPFAYDNRYGIVLVAGPKSQAPPQPQDSELHPIMWQPLRGGDGPAVGTNLSITSNYVFQNGRVGISWASSDNGGKDRGTGIRVTGNHVEVAAGTTCYSVEGRPGHGIGHRKPWLRSERHRLLRAE
jgi:hypothetical protein